MMNRKIVFLLVLVLSTSQINAQFSLRITDEHKLLKEAVIHYELGHYRQTLEDLKQWSLLNPQEEKGDIAFEKAQLFEHLSNLALGKTAAFMNMRDFILNTPYASVKEYGNFKLARYLFQRQEYEAAIPFFERADINYLSNEEISQRNFELAYCYLINQKIEKANPLLASIQNIDGQYASPGNYYHGVMSYYQGNYKEAKESFLAIKNEEAYKNIVPFYLAEINYFEGNKDEAKRIAENYLSETNEQAYQKEMQQLLAQIYLDNGDFSKAQKFQSDYLDLAVNPRDEDFFRAGYSNYQTGQIVEAISSFERVNKSESILGAQAQFYLGLCYLKNGEKENAHKIFTEVLDGGRLGDLNQDVEFNLAKLSYDLSKDELASKQFQAFINRYPSSPYLNNALEMSALLHIKNKNFDNAIKNFNQLNSLSPVMKTVYQKVNYARGIQMLMDGNPDRAIPYFNESNKYPENEDLTALASFWKSECYYRLGNYYDALVASDRFIAKPGAGNNPSMVNNAYLTNAYLHLHMNEKDKVLSAYQKFAADGSISKVSDALAQMDSIKPNYVPSHVPYIDANPYVFIYQMPSQNIQFNYKPMPLKPIAYDQKSLLPNNSNFIKAGYGNLNTPLFKLGYDLSELSGQDLYLQLNHRSSRGKLQHQQQSASGGALAYKTTIADHNVETSLGINQRTIHYYGIQNESNFQTDDLRHRYWNTSLQFKATPTNIIESGWRYEANGGLGSYIASRQDATEMRFHLDVPFEKEINDNLGVGVGLWTDLNFYSKNSNSSVFGIRPFMNAQIKNTFLKLGLYPVVGQNFHLLPNASVAQFIPSISSNVALGVESNLGINSYREQSSLNPFLRPSIELKQSKRNLYYASLFGSPANNIDYQIKAGIGSIKNLPLYINDTAQGAQFDVLYDSKASIISFLAQVEYHLSYNTNAGARLHVQPITNLMDYAEAWHYIPIRLDLYATYVYDNKLLLKGNLFTRSSSKAMTPFGQDQLTNPAAFDLNVQGNYFLNKNWSVFGELNNILSNKYPRWYGYPNFGINVVFGVVYSFDNKLRFPSRNLQIE